MAIKADLSAKVLLNARVLWDYMKLGQPLCQVECLLVLGSHDLRVGQHGVRLFLEGWAPVLVFSGGWGELTSGLWPRTEAEMFAQTAMEMGVPKDKILLEKRSTNSGENVAFTRAMLQERGMDPATFLLVHKPYMERRILATFQKVWPQKLARVTSPPIDFENYPTEEIPPDLVINVMVGDFQRILEYPQKGFLMPQEVPDEAMQAYVFLVKNGFDRHLIDEKET